MKTIGYISVALLLSIHINAQDQPKETRESRKSLAIGLKAGMNRSSVYDEKGQDFVAGNKTGFAGGAFLSIPLGRLLGLQPEVLISQKGFKSSGVILSESYSLERTSTYLDVPLQAQFKPFKFLYVVAGVQYSYLMQQEDHFRFGPNSYEQQQEFENDNIRKNIFGAVGGLDINIRYLVISGRVGWDLQANRGDGSSYTPRYKNLWLQGTLGFRLY